MNAASAAEGTTASSNRAFSTLLEHHPSRCRNQHAGRRQQQPKVPEYATARKQSDRGDHQRNLQEHFAEIEAVGFAVRKRKFPLQFVSFGLEFLLVFFISRNFGANFLLKLG